MGLGLRFFIAQLFFTTVLPQAIFGQPPCPLSVNIILPSSSRGKEIFILPTNLLGLRLDSIIYQNTIPNSILLDGYRENPIKNTKWKNIKQAAINLFLESTPTDLNGYYHKDLSTTGIKRPR